MLNSASTSEQANERFLSPSSRAYQSTVERVSPLPAILISNQQQLPARAKSRRLLNCLLRRSFSFVIMKLNFTTEPRRLSVDRAVINSRSAGGFRSHEKPKTRCSDSNWVSPTYIHPLKASVFYYARLMPCVDNLNFSEHKTLTHSLASLSFPRRSENFHRLQTVGGVAAVGGENVIAKWKMCFLRTMRDEARISESRGGSRDHRKMVHT